MGRFVYLEFPADFHGRPRSAAIPFRCAALALACLSLGASPPNAEAQEAGGPQLQHFGAQLQIEPRRITLTPDNAEARVALSVPWGEGVFDVSLVDRIMTPDGRILAVSESDGEIEAPALIAQLRSARPFVATSAEAIALQSGRAPRDVRVALVAMPPEPGEYRTHLTLTAQRPSDQPAAAPSMTWAHTIPVILRVGPPDAQGVIENARVELRDVDAATTLGARQRVLAFDLVRSGSSSLFGDLSLHMPDGRAVTLAQSIAVYGELDRRRLALPLNGPASGLVELRYTDRDTRPGEVIARAWVNLSPRREADAAKAIGRLEAIAD